MDSIRIYVAGFIALFLLGCNQKNESSSNYNEIAQEMIIASEYCTLITIDSLGHPNGRLMDPMPPDSKFRIYLATNPRSAKVQEITSNPKVSLFYQMSNNAGYVSLVGDAKILTDSESKRAHWKESWEPFYKDKTNDLVLIEFICSKVELVNYKKGIVSTQPNWSAPSFVP